MKTYVIGRSKYSDVVIDVPTVSRKHAELTVTRDSKYYLTDCATTSGTFVAGKETWEKITQSFVSLSDTVLFGRHQISVKDIVNAIKTETEAEPVSG